MKNITRIILLTSILFLSSFLLSGCTPSEETVGKYNKLVNEADLLIEGKEYSSAMEKLNYASELIPERVDSFNRMIEILVLKNRLEDATIVIEESAQKVSDSDKANLYLLVGNAHYDLKNYSKALYNYELAKGFLQSNDEISLGIAKVYLQQNRIEDSKKILDNGYEGSIGIEVKLLLSYIQSLSDIEKAKDLIKDVQPDEEWKGMYASWKETLDSLDDDELFNSAKLSEGYMFGGYPSLVITLLEPKKTEMIEYIDGIYMLGKAYYELEEYQKSIDVLSNATSVSDLNQYIYWVLARDSYMLDDVNKAFTYYESAISFAGDKADARLYQEYLDLMFENNLLSKGAETMRKAERIFDSTWVEIYYMNLYALTKENESFEYHMNKVDMNTIEDRYKGDYLYSKGKYLIENSEFDEAKRTLDIFWDLDKYDPRYNLLFAQLSFEEGNLKDARTYANKSIEYDLDREVTDEAQKLLATVE